MQQNYALVHIASHFVMTSEAGKEPYLQLSSGELTLSGLEDSTISFGKTRLLTLSACSTGTGGAEANGREIDSLGMVAQDKDAAAVLATLWDVSDASTSRLMSDFYTRWMQEPGTAKIEALRQAQIDLLLGDAAVKGGAGRKPAAEQADGPSTDPIYAHPYYWAPFVLMGNYQ